jgi:hypothetical protein
MIAVVNIDCRMCGRRKSMTNNEQLKSNFEKFYEIQKLAEILGKIEL